jgi:hypothetical protein
MTTTMKTERLGGLNPSPLGNLLKGWVREHPQSVRAFNRHNLETAIACFCRQRYGDDAELCSMLLEQYPIALVMAVAMVFTRLERRLSTGAAGDCPGGTAGAPRSCGCWQMRPNGWLAPRWSWSCTGRSVTIRDHLPGYGHS